MKRVVEKIWISFGNISNLETLSNSMIFMTEDKNDFFKTYEIWVGSLKEPNLKSLWNYFQFGVIWVLFKLGYNDSLQRKSGEKWVWNHFGILKYFIWFLNEPVALFA